MIDDEGAPVCRLVVLTVLASSALALSSKTSVGLDTSLFSGHARWRFLGHSWAFQDRLFTVLIGCTLLHSSKTLEQHWGPARFGAYALVVSVLATALQLLALAWGGPSGAWKSIAAGPYGLVLGGLVSLHMELPLSSRQIFLTLLSALITLSGHPGTTLAGACGLAAGCIYRIPFLGLQKLRLPSLLLRFIRAGGPPASGHRLKGPIVRGDLGHASPMVALHPMPGAPVIGANGQVEGTEETIQPDPEAVATLTALGFAEDTVVAALKYANNNVQQASNLLLDN